MKVDPMHRSDGTRKENAQHVMNLLTHQRGMRKVLKSAVLEGTISARMPAPLTPMELMMESCRAERPRHDKRKYPALSVQVSNRVGYGLRFVVCCECQSWLTSIPDANVFKGSSVILGPVRLMIASSGCP